MNSIRLALLGIILAITGLIALFVTNRTPSLTESFPITKNTFVKKDYEKDLALPFSTSDISTSEGTIKPLGVRRTNEDQLGLGHSGIDFPLNPGSPIFAVYYGEILKIEDADDEFDSKKITLLLSHEAAGEGWAFIYEHIDPVENLEVGQEVDRGQLIGYKNTQADYTAHFQMTRLFNDYRYSENDKCWIENLGESERTTLKTFFDSYSTSEYFINSWKTTHEDGRYAYRGLLNTNNFPKPELCYPKGIDVR